MVVAGLLVMRGRIDLRSPFLWPGIAWVVVTAIATATSQRPAASVEALALLLICAPAYYLIRAVLADPVLRPRMDWLIVVSTTIFVIAYLLQALTQWVSWWSVAGPSIPPLRPGDVGLTVGTVNAVALYLELLVPIAVWLSWTRWHSRPFSIGLATLGAFALLVTGSRGAWLGAAAGAVVLVALVWRTRGLSLARFGSPRRRWIVAIVVAAGAVLLVPTFATRLLSGDAGRIELWTAAWSMFTSSPIVGVGPGAWPMMRAFTPISDDNFAVLATSHNSLLQILAETGLIGLVAAAWLVVTIARVGWRAVATGRTLDDRTTAAIALGSLAAAGVHSIVDTQFHLPAIVLLVLHLAARLELIAPSEPAVVGSRRRRRLVLVSAAGGVVVGALLLVPIDTAMVRAAVGNAALDRGDPGAALPEFDAAVALHRLPAYRLGLAIAARALGDDGKAAAALGAMARDEPFTFVTVQQAALAADPAPFWARTDAAGPYDATASANLAVQRFPTDPAGATHDLASAMIQVPTLVYSERPRGLFDDATWAAAQTEAIGRIGTTDRRDRGGRRTARRPEAMPPPSAPPSLTALRPRLSTCWRSPLRTAARTSRQRVTCFDPRPVRRASRTCSGCWHSRRSRSRSSMRSVPCRCRSSSSFRSHRWNWSRTAGSTPITRCGCRAGRKPSPAGTVPSARMSGASSRSSRSTARSDSPPDQTVAATAEMTRSICISVMPGQIGRLIAPA